MTACTTWKAPKQCGIDCIGVTFGFGDREELEDAGAKHVVDRVEELLPLAALNSHKKLSFETAFLCFRAEKTAQKSANYAGFLSYYGAHCAII